MKFTNSVFIMACLGFTLMSCDNSPKVDATKEADAPKKSDDEIRTEAIANVAVEVGKGSIEAVKERNARIRREDSLKAVNMPQRWVYIIGDQIGSEKEAWKEYDKFKDIPNLYLLKKSKSEYYLIKDDQFSTKQINDSIDAFKKRIANLEPKVEIGNLATKCPHEQPKVTDPIIYRKDGKKEAPCRVCD